MLQKTIAGVLLAWGLAAGQGVHAAACPAFYVDGQPPQIRNLKLAASTRELCYEVFGVMHSGVTRTPLWSGEHLTGDNVEAARDLSRENSFHPEMALPADQRAELADYARSGFDRGHMAPNGDMPDRRSQHDSFTLANMVPQNSENNRHIWAGIEAVVRKLAVKEGDLYVITGPAFIGGNLQKVGNVLVPTDIYKVVYSPRQHAGAAYFIANRPTDDYQVLSIAALEAKIGIDLMPALSASEKATVLHLPAVRGKKTKRQQ